MKRKRTEEISSQGENHERERFYRKNAEFFQLIDKIRLWPARGGILHGIRSMEFHGTTARITTFCGESFVVRNSRNSRAARWLRNNGAVVNAVPAGFRTGKSLNTARHI